MFDASEDILLARDWKEDVILFWFGRKLMTTANIGINWDDAALQLL